MATTTFLDSAELSLLNQQLMPERIANDILFTDLLPFRAIRERIILKEQRDSFFGTTPGRNPGAGFGQLARESKNRLSITPYDFGEDALMDEEFLLKSRQIGQFGVAQNNAEEQQSDLIKLQDRFFKRVKYNWWTLVTTGTYTVLGPAGEYVGGDSYTFQSFTVATAWSNYAASTPILDLRNQKLLHRGTSASFGRKAKIFMQSQDVNNLLSNTNPNDLGAKRVITQNAGAQPFQLGDVNRFLLDSDLPEIVEYDEFLPTGASNFVTGPAPYSMFIPYQTAVCFGARDYGEPVAYYTMVPQFPHVMEDGGMASMQAKQVQRMGLDQGNMFANIYIDFKIDMEKWYARTRIAYGGAPQIDYPSAIIVMNLN